MRYLLDTNILLHLLRQDLTGERIMKGFKVYNSTNPSLVSEVSIGELQSIGLQRQWSQKRRAEIQILLGNFATMPIGFPDIYQRYAEIDAFSQGNFPGKPLNQSARNMGKNDLWVAATASVLGAKLLSTDADFDHLDGVFLDLERINRDSATT